MSRNQRIRWADNNCAGMSLTSSPADIDPAKPFSNLFTESRTEVWRCANTFTLEYDFGAAITGSCFYLLPRYGEHSPLSGAATVTLRANNVPDFSTPAYTTTLTGNDQGILSFMDTEADGYEPHYRYWQIELDDQYNPEAELEFSLLYLGDYLTLDLRNVQRGFNIRTIDTSREFQSEGGQRYFDERIKFKQIDNISLAFVTPENRREIQEWVRTKGITRPTMVSIDPTDKLSGGDPFELAIYGLLESPPTFTHVKTDVYTITMRLKEYI